MEKIWGKTLSRKQVENGRNPFVSAISIDKLSNQNAEMNRIFEESN